MIIPHDPINSAYFGKFYLHHVSSLTHMHNISKRSFLLCEIFNKSSFIRIFMHCSEYIQITP